MVSLACRGLKPPGLGFADTAMTEYTSRRLRERRG